MSLLDLFRPPMRPAFLIIGAQKAGTSALFRMIAAHQQVAAPVVKEHHFFDNDLHYARGMRHYLSGFPRKGPATRGRITFEATPNYLFNEASCERIHRELPGVRLIVVLRDPVSRAFSAWNMFRDFANSERFAHLHDPRSFEQAVEDELAGRTAMRAHRYLARGHYAPQLRRFIEDSQAEEEQKRVEHGKLDALIGFTEAPGCRRRLLLRHFGEELVADCGNCDGCLDPQPRSDATVPAQKALSAVYRTGQRFGAAHVVDVLLGANSERIRALGHDQLSVYGIGGELDRGQWRAVLRQLTSLGYLQAPAESRGGLCFGDEALVRPLLRGETSLELALPPPQKERRSGSAAGASQAIAADSVDGVLLNALKNWRREQARQQGVPPYVVFHDRTLVELAARRPADMEELSGVGGIGAAKLDRYGEELLAVLASDSQIPQP